jgi:hypothetical protein
MNLPNAHFRQEAQPQPTIARVVGSADVRWDRWTFKAPPLDVAAPQIDFRQLSAEIQNRLSTIAR